MTTPASRRLVVVVDADPASVEEGRLLLQGGRVLVARTTDEAAEIVTGGRVDLVVRGPSFGNESAVLGAGSLRVADPGVVIVLAANIVTNRILLGALRSGIADVIDTPLTLRKLDDVLGRGASRDRRPPRAPRRGADPPRRSIDVVLPSAFPPPPSTPPPSTRVDSWEPPRYADAGPNPLERAPPLPPPP